MEPDLKTMNRSGTEIKKVVTKDKKNGSPKVTPHHQEEGKALWGPKGAVASRRGEVDSTESEITF